VVQGARIRPVWYKGWYKGIPVHPSGLDTWHLSKGARAGPREAMAPRSHRALADSLPAYPDTETSKEAPT